MASVRPFGAALGIGFESTWGTAVSRTNWIRPTSMGLRRVVERENIDHLGTFGQAAATRRFFRDSKETVGGRIVIPAAYSDSTVALLYHAMGANATTGSNPYTHTLTLAEPSQTGLTLEQLGGTHASADVSQVFEGCLVDGFELSVEAGGQASLGLDIIAETAGAMVAAGSPSYASAQYRPMLAHHCGQITFNSVALNWSGWRLSYRRGLTRNYQLGSLLTALPVPQRGELELEIDVLWEVDTWMDAHLAGTQADATWSFGDSPRSAGFTLHNAVVWDCSHPIQDGAGIKQTITLRAFADTSDQGLQIAMVNANSAVTGNG